MLSFLSPLPFYFSQFLFNADKLCANNDAKNFQTFLSIFIKMNLN